MKRLKHPPKDPVAQQEFLIEEVRRLHEKFSEFQMQKLMQKYFSHEIRRLDDLVTDAVSMLNRLVEAGEAARQGRPEDIMTREELQEVSKAGRMLRDVVGSSPRK
jgi:hypothetical protein